MTESIDCDTATAQELAAAVVNYIETHGWLAGSMGSSDGPVCLLGGVSAVCEGDPRYGFDVWDGDDEKGTPAAVEALKVALKADGQIPILRGELDSYSIYRFNDASDRTREQALAPFRRVAGLPEVLSA